jgi:hypothetical protein
MAQSAVAICRETGGLAPSHSASFDHRRRPGVERITLQHDVVQP